MPKTAHVVKQSNTSNADLWTCDLTALPQGPMVRDVVFVRVLDLLAERYADGDYRPFIGAINQLLKDTAEVTHETPEHFSLGRFPQAVPSPFFQELLYAAALNGPRALVATMCVLNIQQFQSLAGQEIKSVERAIRMTIR